MSRERLARAGIVSLLGGGTGAVLGLVLAVVVGRGLGGEGTGHFFQMVALFMILANVLELGADTGLVRELSRQVSLGRIADLTRTVFVAVVPVIAVSAVVLTTVWLAAPALAGLISEPAARDTTTSLIVQTTPFVLAASLVAVLLGGTRGLGGVLPFTGIHNIALPAVRVLGVLIVLAAGLGLYTAAQAWAWPFVAAAGAAAVILTHQLSRTLAHSGPSAAAATPLPALAREFWSFSAPRGVAAALEIALVWADVLIVAALSGPTAAGIYAVVSRCAQAGLLVENAMRMAMSPRISAAIATGDTAGARRLHLAATRSMILGAWPLYVTLALFAPVVLAVFGDDFRDGALALIVLSGAMLIWTGAGMVQTVLLMGGRSHWQMRNKGIALAVNVVGNLTLIPLWGITGAAVAWTVTIALDAGLATLQVHRLMRIRVALVDLRLPAAIVVAAVAVPGAVVLLVLGATPVALAVHLVLATIAHVGACWTLRERLGWPSPGAPAVPPARFGA